LTVDARTITSPVTGSAVFSTSPESAANVTVAFPFASNFVPSMAANRPTRQLHWLWFLGRCLLDA
jgi:hypothetical protein